MSLAHLTGPVARNRLLVPAEGLPGITKSNGANSSEGATSFVDTLKGYLQEVTDLETKADQQIQGVAEGSVTDVHQVMMAVEEANLALDLLIEIRNRLIEAYQELTRTAL